MTMHSVIWLLLIIPWIVTTAPVENQNTEVVKYENTPYADNGSYYFSYETKDGIFREESAEPKLTKDNIPYLSVKGFYSYDNIIVVYDADENGYRSFIVKLPPVGEEVKDKNVDELTPKLGKVGELDNRIPASVIGSLLGGGLG